MRLYYPNEYGTLIRLGIPVLISHAGMTLQNLADNVMVGQHSTEELAAAGFVNNLFVLGILLTLGFSIGAVSQIGALYAQDNKPRMMEILKSSLVADTLQGLLVGAALVGLNFMLPHMGQPDELIPLMRPYLVIQILSLPFICVSNAFRQFTDSINDTVVAMSIMLVGNVWNIIGNWLLIFGHMGCPEMGIEGAAWATWSSRLVILLLSLAVFYLRPKYKVYVRQMRKARMAWKDVRLLNMLGWPIAVQMGMEVASFTVVVIFLGWFGTHMLAAHQVMISITNLIFMFYIGISTAVSIRVSNHNGLHNMRGVRQAAFAGWEIILCMGVVLNTIVFLLRHDIAGAFTDNEEVSAIVTTLMWPLMLYQLGDGCQVTFANALRGMGDVRCLVPYSFLAYVVISLPLSYFMGVVLEWKAFGVWMAFPFGLSTAAILYLRRFLKVSLDERLHRSMNNEQ